MAIIVSKCECKLSSDDYVKPHVQISLVVGHLSRHVCKFDTYRAVLMALYEEVSPTSLSRRLIWTSQLFATAPFWSGSLRLARDVYHLTKSGLEELLSTRDTSTPLFSMYIVSNDRGREDNLESLDPDGDDPGYFKNMYCYFLSGIVPGGFEFRKRIIVTMVLRIDNSSFQG